MDEEPTPYDDPGLREAERRGRKAHLKKKSAFMDLIVGAGAKGQAWPVAYEDCGTQDARD